MKENKQPILSICIPTYNRRYSLQYTLKSIMDQDEFKSGDVEIVISDNASTDETEAEIKKLCKKYRNIRYFRNEENIGSNPNINKVISLGEGEYLWWLGSDSFIINNGLKKTVNIVKYFSPDIIYFNAEEKKAMFSMSNDGILSFFSQRELLQFLGDMSEENFIQCENTLSFISSRCLSKKYYLEAIKIADNINNFDNHSFSQSILCNCSDTENSIVFLIPPVITRFSIKKTGYFVDKKIIKDHFDFIKLLNRRFGINDTSYKRLIRKSHLFWIRSYIYGCLYCKIVNIFKSIGIYETTSKFWRKYILRVEK